MYIIVDMETTSIPNDERMNKETVVCAYSWSFFSYKREGNPALQYMDGMRGH